MKFNINKSLFKIETNDDFHTKKIKQNKLHDKVLRNFGIKEKYSISIVNKQSASSKIYFIKTKKNNYVMRESTSKNSKYLKNQCEAINRMKKSFFFKLKRGKTGFVYKFKNNFILYEKIQGTIFNGQVSYLNKIFNSIIDLHKDLEKKSIINLRLKNKKYRTRQIKKRTILLTNKNYLKKICLKKIINKKTKKLIIENIDYFENCINSVVKFKNTEEKPQVVHADLNHSNFIISKKSIRFIDLENLGYGNFKVEFAFGIFKILRHAVFKNKYKLTYINNYSINLINKLIKKNIFINHYEIFHLCSLRILSNISLIIYSIFKGEKKYIYDFEKQILNLIELRYIFKLHEFKS